MSEFRYCERSRRADAKCGGSTSDTRLSIFCMWGLALTPVDLRYEDELKRTSTLHDGGICKVLSEYRFQTPRINLPAGMDR
jgi:hypothetical protein